MVENMNYVGKSVTKDGKVGVIMESFTVDNPESQYTHIFRVMYPDKKRDILIYPFHGDNLNASVQVHGIV